jgi:hypothetical protein
LGTLGAIALAGALGAAQADFAVSEIEARFAERALQLSGALDLTLTPKVEEALAKGIPLDVVIGVRLLRVRAWLWDERAGSWTVKRRIRYHALSGQYLVSAADANPEINESYTVLGEALKQLGVFDRLQLPLPEAPLPDARYQVQVRAHLDLESLPTPLQPVAYTSLAWHLNSGWSLWQVAR